MLRKYRDWKRGEFVVVGADTAMGGLDYSAAVFLSKTSLDLPLVFHSKAMATERKMAMMTCRALSVLMSCS